MMRKVNFLKIAVHTSAWLLAGWLVFDALTGNLTVNPVQAATQRTGKFALIFLMLSLACTPLNSLFGWRQALTVRRALGLYAFLFAVSHFLIFSGVDFGFDLSLILAEITQRRYILVGTGTLLILTLLAITSFKWWMKRLGKNWKRLHRLVYLAGILVIVHYAWAKKGDVLRLQGDIIQPLIFGAVMVLLLLLRLPVIRKQIHRRPNPKGSSIRTLARLEEATQQDIHSQGDNQYRPEVSYERTSTQERPKNRKHQCADEGHPKAGLGRPATVGEEAGN
jgi:sulfoxide reductase heme-binding subunit YedZ